MDTSLQFQVAQETAQPLQDLDPHRLSQRQRQIDFGKNTAGYTAYTERVPKSHRKHRSLNHPSTPDIQAPVSKRCFDGQVKAWRRALHKWEPAGLETALDFGDLMTPSESECGSARRGSYAAAVSGSAPSSRAPSEAGTPRHTFLARQPSFTPCSINQEEPARAPVGSAAEGALGGGPRAQPDAAAYGAQRSGSGLPSQRKRKEGRFAAGQAEDLRLQSPTKKLRHQISKTSDAIKAEEAKEVQWADENQTPASGPSKVLANGLKPTVPGKQQLLLSAGQHTAAKQGDPTPGDTDKPKLVEHGIFGDWEGL